MFFRNWSVRIGGTALVLLVLVSTAAPWLGTVDPTLFDAASRDLRPGEAGEIATLEGDTLSISGTFTGLTGPATKAHLSMSAAPGIPGVPLVDLTLTGDVAAVQSAVEAGAQMVAQKGMLVNRVVIPRPRPELLTEMI